MSSKNKISDLRDRLFDQLDRLNDPANDIEIELKKAKAYVDIGNVIVNSAKAQVDFMRVAGVKEEGKGFFLPPAEQNSEISG